MEHLFISSSSVLNILQDFCGRLTAGGVFIVIKRFCFCGSKTLSVPMDGWVLCFYIYILSHSLSHESSVCPSLLMLPVSGLMHMATV